MKISIFILVAALISLTFSSIYSVSPDFKVTFEVSPSELAHATYQERIYEKGWNYLHIYASPRVGLLQQHRGAGFLQGYLEYKGIYSAYQNFCAKLVGGEQIHPQAQSFVDKQLEYLDKMIIAHPRDIYWQYAEAYLQQLRYMYRGYLTRINLQKSLQMYISFSNFYYLTNTGDLEDLMQAFSINNGQMQKKPGNCNGYVKLLNFQLYIGHSTHNIYQFMIRTMKTYHFPTRNQNVGSEWISFSSRPGDIISKDDFYVLSSGLVVMETSFGNYERSNYQDLSPNTVPCWLRQTIAANLAKNGDQWVDYFLKQRSGTHNNQWAVIDKNRLSIQPLKNIVVFVQEAFSQYDVIDMTERLQEKGFVASYNVPFSQTIYAKLGYDKYPYTYEDDPRAYQYTKYDMVINNVSDMKKWLLNNDNQDPTVGIAPRYDLKENGASVFGLTDLKIVTPETLKSGYILAYSGPSKSNGRFPAFDWSDWPSESSEGMPRKWDFDWEMFKIMEQSMQKKDVIISQI